MLSLEEAIERSLAATPKLGGETISLANAEGRFAASDAKAKVSLPAFDNSAMDGYAVRSCDLKSATADSPVGLMCVGVIPAGTFPAGSLESETCMRIYTGSPIPDGTDAVIMQEDCRSTPGDGSTILCN
jgi:molybdopterin molybdotransferase